MSSPAREAKAAGQSSAATPKSGDRTRRQAVVPGERYGGGSDLCMTKKVGPRSTQASGDPAAYALMVPYGRCPTCEVVIAQPEAFGHRVPCLSG